MFGCPGRALRPADLVSFCNQTHCFYRLWVSWCYWTWSALWSCNSREKRRRLSTQPWGAPVLSVMVSEVLLLLLTDWLTDLLLRTSRIWLQRGKNIMIKCQYEVQRCVDRGVLLWRCSRFTIWKRTTVRLRRWPVAKCREQQEPVSLADHGWFFFYIIKEDK